MVGGILKGSVDKIKPESHLLHFNELMFVPSSVGSRHRAHRHVK